MISFNGRQQGREAWARAYAHRGPLLEIGTTVAHRHGKFSRIPAQPCMLDANPGARGSFLREPIQVPDATPDSISTCIARLTVGRKFTISLRAVGPFVSKPAPTGGGDRRPIKSPASVQESGAFSIQAARGSGSPRIIRSGRSRLHRNHSHSFHTWRRRPGGHCCR